MFERCTSIDNISIISLKVQLRVRPLVSLLLHFIAFICLLWYDHSNTVNSVFLFWPIQSDELSLQKKLRTEVIQLEDTLAQVRKEYEMLRIEFEQNLAANEQAGT